MEKSTMMKKALIALVAPLLLSGAVMAAEAKQEKKEVNLELAYKKEFAFLEAQKRSLESRIGEFEKSAQADIKAAKREIESLQEKLLIDNAKVDKLQELLLTAERESEMKSDNTGVLDATFLQAEASMEKFGYKAPKAPEGKLPAYSDNILDLFLTSKSVLEELGKVRKTDGEYFLADGTRTSGTIVKAGNIASYAIGTGGSGILVPAGGGAMKLWNVPSAASAEAVVMGDRPDALQVFIYESDMKAVAAQDEKTVGDVLESGGIIGYVIVALGIVGLLLVVFRTVFLQRARKRTGSVSDEIYAMVSKGQAEQALAACQNQNGAISRVMGTTLRNIDRDREHLEDIVSESILHESSYLDRFGGSILVIAGVAPLLGLLGTVTGMISTFDVITEFGTGDPKLLSGGISEALVTTELGLIVAIPALVFGNLLSGWAENIKNDMEQAALKLINVYTSYKHGR